VGYWTAIESIRSTPDRPAEITYAAPESLLSDLRRHDCWSTALVFSQGLLMYDVKASARSVEVRTAGRPDGRHCTRAQQAAECRRQQPRYSRQPMRCFHQATCLVRTCARMGAPDLLAQRSTADTHRTAGDRARISLEMTCWPDRMDSMTPTESNSAYLPGLPARASFTAIEQPRAHDFVVEQIRRQVALGIIPPGAALPPERELVRLFGVGRVTVQLAIGQLEAEHVIETRRGRTGGSFVITPASDSRALDLRVVELKRHAARVIEAVEFREALEPVAAGVAATKVKRKQVSELKNAIERVEAAQDDAEFMRWDTALHLAIAAATGNQFMSDALERIRLELNPALQLLPDTRRWHALSHQEHRDIVGALAAKDAGAATEHMRAHIAHSGQSIRTLMKSLSRS
jgi:GntR family transcriptional repressor for pyruvate dehydrogenase complex